MKNKHQKKKTEVKLPESKPLTIINLLTRKIPGIWDRLDEIRELKKVQYPELTDVDIPSPMVMDLLKDVDIAKATEGDHVLLATLSTWRKDKQEFELDSDIEKELLKQDSLGNIPVDILRHLPYRSFYVKTNHFVSSGRPIDGFFVSLDYSPVYDEHHLNITIFYSDNVIVSEYISLSCKTVEESVDKTLNLFYREMGYIDRLRFAILDGDNNLKEYREKSVVQLTQALNILLYILASNSDKTLSKRPFKRTPTIKDKPIEIQKWNVGRRMGSVFRASKLRCNNIPSNNERSYTGSTAPKRPHIRRAHWHHYWTGKRGTPQRQLVLKWCPPASINMTVGDDHPVTVHKVKR